MVKRFMERLLFASIIRKSRLVTGSIQFGVTVQLSRHTSF